MFVGARRFPRISLDSATHIEAYWNLMKTDDFLLLGLKNCVTAISRSTGKTIWCTNLPGGMGYDFVTLLNDGERVYAHSKGKLHALDLTDGRLLWSNDLPGYGYGMASLALPGGLSAPDAQAVALLHQQQASAASNGGGAG